MNERQQLERSIAKETERERLYRTYEGRATQKADMWKKAADEKSNEIFELKEKLLELDELEKVKP